MNPTTTAPGFGATLASEWRKFRSVPVHRTVLIITVLLTVGLTFAIVLFSTGATLAEQQREGTYDVVLFSSAFGIWAFLYLAAVFVSAEFRTGMAHTTFVATPRRSRVMVAKMLILLGVGLVVGLLVSAANIALTQGALAVGGYPTLELGDPELLRSVLLYIPAGMCLLGMFGCVLAVLIRNAFGAVVLTILIQILPPLFAQFLGAGYANTVVRWTPGAVVESIAGLTEPGSGAYLPLPVALLVAALWIGVLGAIAVGRLHRTDVR